MLQRTVRKGVISLSWDFATVYSFVFLPPPLSILRPSPFVSRLVTIRIAILTE
jgi:hypothetical protein